MDYRLALRDKSDQKYRQFSLRLIKSRFPMLGVRIPEIKKLARAAARDGDFELFEPVFYEEVMLIGLVSVQRPDFVTAFEKFLPYIDNWAICDTVIAALPVKDANRRVVLDRFLRLKSGGEFERRALAVLLLGDYLKADYIDEALTILTDLANGAYYTNMAVAWALATAAVEFYQKTLTLLKSGRLSDFVLTKTVQKAVESYRIDAARKEELKELKRGCKG